MPNARDIPEQEPPTTGNLENPQPSSNASGIRIISGWHCDAQSIQILIDDLLPLTAAYGTSRDDTLSSCGDSDNGFALLWNYNILGDGPHTVRALADGVEFANSTFTVTTLGTEFLRDASGSAVISNFPGFGDALGIRWQEALQNFIIDSYQRGGAF